MIAVWSLAYTPRPRLNEEHAWRLVEQYEARLLEFVPEFVEPSDRLRRLRPDTLVYSYSYEWFEDDPGSSRQWNDTPWHP